MARIHRRTSKADIVAAIVGLAGATGLLGLIVDGFFLKPGRQFRDAEALMTKVPSISVPYTGVPSAFGGWIRGAYKAEKIEGPLATNPYTKGTYISMTLERNNEVLGTNYVPEGTQIELLDIDGDGFVGPRIRR